jgi:hypothetical protein
MRFAAKMPGAGSIGRGSGPLENGKLRVAALNDIPVQRVAGDRSADFAPEFLNRRHGFLRNKSDLEGNILYCLPAMETVDDSNYAADAA